MELTVPPPTFPGKTECAVKVSTRVGHSNLCFLLEWVALSVAPLLENTFHEALCGRWEEHL